MTKYKVSIDEEKCIGCGVCVATCEAHFKMNDAGKAIIKGSKELDKLGCVKEASDVCPVSAIEIKEI